mgnify:CR=1 FL=1
MVDLPEAIQDAFTFKAKAKIIYPLSTALRPLPARLVIQAGVISWRALR